MSAQPLWYGLPAWPLAMLAIPLYVYLPAYYHELGVGLAAIGLALLLARVSDLVTDPVLGWLRDHLSARGHYLMIIIGWALLLFGLWFLLLPTTPSFWTLLFWSLVVYFAWTLIMIPYQALSAEVTASLHYKTSFTAVREGFAIIGVLSVLSLPVALGVLPTSRDLFVTVYLLVAALLTLFLGLMLWRLQRPALALVKNNQSARDVIVKLRSIWEDAASRRLLPAYFLNSLANALPATLFVLFVQGYLDLESYTGVLLVAYFIAGIMALPAWAWLAKRIGKYQAWQLSILLASLSFIWVFALEPGNLIGFLIISFISGLSLGADVALPSSIQADVAQDLSKQQGPMNGVLFGIWGMLTKLALALAVGLSLPLIDWAGWEQQTATSMTMILWLYAGVPVMIKLVVLAYLQYTGRQGMTKA
ncbi:MFS transporter [Thiomicrospira sp. ALE5]|uniref:MFS transporter n=1 Tax=Thiomicrospira sp. ALE5 TaxID=748650 RepID=UPI0008EC9400|nr:MFS transporter [Thiomicrospira sp. ALE5]SFR62834.1 Na+/melibiose symporter [Thiomicrospira sp. ALE5]